MADNVQALIGVEDDKITVDEEVEFEHAATSAQGMSCQITVSATGAELAELATFADLTNAFNVVFQSMGFEPEGEPESENPNSTSYVMRRGSELAFIRLEAAPADNVTDCPADQLVDECGLEPEQVSYTARVDYTRQGGQ
jgi:hypothetical protein